MAIILLERENNLNALYVSAVGTTQLAPVYVGLIAALILSG